MYKYIHLDTYMSALSSTFTMHNDTFYMYVYMYIYICAYIYTYRHTHIITPSSYDVCIYIVYCVYTGTHTM
jgi:hypothetical protein